MRARASMAALLAVSFFVAGCGDGDEPEAEPTPILPSSSEPEPTPRESEAAEEEPPEMPEEAREESTAGAEAFIDHWAAVFNFATVTGNTSEFDALSLDSCRACSNISRSLNKLYDRGGRIESDGWAVKQIGFPSEDAADMPVVRFERSRERVFRSEDAEPDVFRPEDMTYTFELQRESTGWSVRDLREAS